MMQHVAVETEQAEQPIIDGMRGNAGGGPTGAAAAKFFKLWR
jgi:hypothetical protein